VKKGFVILTIFLCIIIAAGIFWANSLNDKIGPQLSFPEGVLSYEEGNHSLLLEGVTAFDDVDGDVSSSIRISGIFPTSSGDKANVLYVAKDSSNNVSKASREVLYVAKNSEATTTSDDVTQSDDTQEETGVQVEQVAKPTVTPKASATPAVSTTPVVDEGAPVITLTDSEVTLSRGASINRLVYVENITDDKDERNDLFRAIQISGDVDTATPGVYEVLYHVVDSDGYRSNVAILIVTVQ